MILLCSEIDRFDDGFVVPHFQNVPVMKSGNPGVAPLENDTV